MYICRGQGARGEGLNIHPTPSTPLPQQFRPCASFSQMNPKKDQLLKGTNLLQKYLLTLMILLQAKAVRIATKGFRGDAEEERREQG